MRKHMKLIIIAIVAALALTVCFPVLALAGSSDGETVCCEGPRQTHTWRGGPTQIHIWRGGPTQMHIWHWGPTQLFISDVADILELDEEQVADAFTQALQEMWEKRDEADTDLNPKDIFISKVAGILGLTEEQVADAIEQARQEMRDEVFEQRLDNAVENGLITEEEAAEIQEWWDNRPAALDKLGPPGHPRLHMWYGPM